MQDKCTKFWNEKKIVYKRNYKAKRLVVHAVQSKKEEINQKLKNFKIRNRKNIRYISFYESDSENCLTYLYLNNMNNT